MLKLNFSALAKQDIEEIFEYTINIFGNRKADEYSTFLFAEIQMLQINPKIGHGRKDIPLGCLAWPFEQHIIIYEIWENCIFINRILHSKMNFLEQF